MIPNFLNHINGSIKKRIWSFLYVIVISFYPYFYIFEIQEITLHCKLNSSFAQAYVNCTFLECFLNYNKSVNPVILKNKEILTGNLKFLNFVSKIEQLINYLSQKISTRRYLKLLAIMEMIHQREIMDIWHKL